VTTIAKGLLDWVEQPDPDRGIHFANDQGGWDYASFEELARGAFGVASLLGERGLTRGGVVSVVAPTRPSFVTAFFGTLLAGGTPSPLVPPFYYADIDGYISQTAARLETASELVLTDESLREIVGRAHAAAGLEGEPLVIEQAIGSEACERRPPSELALLQFTSGSSGRPRGVRVTWENLEANVEMIRGSIDWSADDVGAGWLPMYHDMGLIGCLVTPVAHQREIWIMRPDHFVRDPMLWLERFGRHGATLTAAPNFCFAYAAKRLQPEQLEGMDFSAWRAAIIGAERLDPGVLGRFAAMLEPHGFRREVFLPAYGLAEATLAVSIQDHGRVPRVVRPDWARVGFGRTVTVTAEALIGDPQIGDGAGWLIGCGEPLPGVTVTVADDAGCPLPDGTLGELTVEGATVASGYAGGAESVSSSFADGILRTGDAGFIHDGEVYVTGRIGDALKFRGVTLYAEDLEAKVAAIDGVPRGRCVVVPGLAAGVDSVTVIAEAGPGEWIEQARRLLARETGGAKVTILLGPPGTIERTSSGKPRRRVIWRALVDGELVLEPSPA
jgi:acyl-CoA synthetase (AMP-forming)/AMP-acid ligase II